MDLARELVLGERLQRATARREHVGELAVAGEQPELRLGQGRVGLDRDPRGELSRAPRPTASKWSTRGAPLSSVKAVR